MEAASPAARQSQKHAFVVSPACRPKSTTRVSKPRSASARFAYCSRTEAKVRDGSNFFATLRQCFRKCVLANDCVRSVSLPNNSNFIAEVKLKSHSSRARVHSSKLYPKDRSASDSDSSSSVSDWKYSPRVELKQNSTHACTRGPHTCKASWISSSVKSIPRNISIVIRDDNVDQSWSPPIFFLRTFFS